MNLHGIARAALAVLFARMGAQSARETSRHEPSRRLDEICRDSGKVESEIHHWTRQLDRQNQRLHLKGRHI